MTLFHLMTTNMFDVSTGFFSMLSEINSKIYKQYNWLILILFYVLVCGQDRCEGIDRETDGQNDPQSKRQTPTG